MNDKNLKTVRDLSASQSGEVVALSAKGALRRRIIDMGITPGAIIRMRKTAPFGDPIEINVRGYELSIRKKDAENIIIRPIEGR